MQIKSIDLTISQLVLLRHLSDLFRLGDQLEFSLLDVFLCRGQVSVTSGCGGLGVTSADLRRRQSACVTSRDTKAWPRWDE